MSKTALILLISLLLAGQADAMAKPPHIRHGTSYEVAKARLMKAGFLPAHIVALGDVCGPGNACKSEQLHCGGPVDYCEELFVRRSDEAFFVVTADGITPDLEYARIFAAGPKYLRNFDVKVITPSGRHRSFMMRYPDQAEPPTPLCRDVPAHTLPCWVSPPKGHRPPVKPAQ